MIRLFVWCIFFDCYAVTFAGSHPYFLGRSDRLGYREGRGSSLTGVMLVNAPLDLCRQVKNEQQAKLGDTLTASEPEDSTTVTPVIMTLGCRGFLPLRREDGWGDIPTLMFSFTYIHAKMQPDPLLQNEREDKRQGTGDVYPCLDV